MRYAVMLCWLIVSIVRAGGASTAPATRPAVETLLAGKLTYTPPAGWDLQGKLDGGKTAAYALEPDRARLAITVNEQEIALDDAAATRMGQYICKKLREDVPRSGAEIHTPPRAEKDDRFFLRVHDSYTRDGKLCERLQIYRVLGLELVTVAVTSFGDSPDEVTTIFADAERMLLSVEAPGRKLSSAQAGKPRAPASKPVVLEEAGLRLTPPPGWRVELSDHAEGIIATFRDPDDETNMIAVSARQLPREARSDPKLRDALVDQIVGAERQQFKIEGATLQGTEQLIKDNRFLRKSRTRYQTKEKQFEVGSRQLRVGNTVVSVTAVCLLDHSPDVEKLADDVAAQARVAAHP
jgi:hypothetical protein